MMVKICGITNREDAWAAVEGGASALGFNLWPRSPRYVPPERIAELVAGLPPRVWKVGVFVNESAEAVARLAGELGLDVVQLHGETPPPAGLRIWRAVPVDAGFQAELLDRYEAEAFLLDAPAGPLVGGTGRSFDWRRVAGLKHRIILAGGLDADNVGEAIRTARPWGVDACSRLESAPGKKDHRKLAAFLEAALAEEAS
jgi:phosphoribosylanthranilate isomerase